MEEGRAKWDRKGHSLFDKVVVVKVEVVHDKEIRARVLTSGECLLKAAYGAVIRLVMEEAVKET